MDVYIDKENLYSFIASNSHELYEDCYRMLKRNCDIKFTFSQREAVNDQLMLMWINTLNSGLKGGSGSVSWDQHFLTRPLKSNLYKECNKELKKMSAVYLINAEKTEDVSNKKFMLIAPKGREIEVLSSLLFEDYQYTKTLDAQKDLKKWGDIKRYLSPCTDIIISDPYILCDPSVYRNNLYELVKDICSYAQATKLNVVLFTVRSENIDVESIKKELKKTVKEMTGVAPDVTLVFQNKAPRHSNTTLSEKKAVEHDRTIFTNYKYITSGDTFNYFNGKYEIITSGRWLTICSMASKENFEHGIDFIKKLQDVIDTLRRKNRIKDSVDGSGNCNYLRIKE